MRVLYFDRQADDCTSFKRSMSWLAGMLDSNFPGSEGLEVVTVESLRQMEDLNLERRPVHVAFFDMFNGSDYNIEAHPAAQYLRERALEFTDFDQRIYFFHQIYFIVKWNLSKIMTVIILHRYCTLLHRFVCCHIDCLCQIVVVIMFGFYSWKFRMYLRQ